MREVVPHFSTERFLQRMGQTLSQVFCRGGESKFVTLSLAPLNNPCQHVIFSRALGFISQKVLDLILVVYEKRAIQKYKTAHVTSVFLFAGRASHNAGFSFGNPHIITCCPAPVLVENHTVDKSPVPAWTEAYDVARFHDPHVL